MVTVESCGGHSYRDIRSHGGADGDDGSEDPEWSVVVDVEVCSYLTKYTQNTCSLHLYIIMMKSTFSHRV